MVKSSSYLCREKLRWRGNRRSRVSKLIATMREWRGRIIILPCMPYALSAKQKKEKVDASLFRHGSNWFCDMGFVFVPSFVSRATGQMCTPPRHLLSMSYCLRLRWVSAENTPEALHGNVHVWPVLPEFGGQDPWLCNLRGHECWAVREGTMCDRKSYYLPMVVNIPSDL